MPTSITTTMRMARAMFPVVSAETGAGVAVAVGVSVGGGVGMKVASSVGGGRLDVGGGVGVSPGGGTLTLESEVGIKSLCTDGRLILGVETPKTVAA